jgi:signal peptidase I
MARPRSTLVVGLLVFGVLVVLFVAGHSDTRDYRVPSGSMEPTFKIGDRLTVNLDAYRSAQPRIGDVVVFHPPAGAVDNSAQCGDRTVNVNTTACPVAVNREDAATTFFKRVVAGPGDTVVLRGGHVYRDGRRERDAYVAPCHGGDGCDLPTAVTIPAGHWFLLGDNRGASDDSRFWGAIPAAWIIGRVDDCHLGSTFCSARR